MLFSRKIFYKLVVAIFAVTMLVSCEEWEGLFPNCRFQDKVEAKLLGQDPQSSYTRVNPDFGVSYTSVRYSESTNAFAPKP